MRAQKIKKFLLTEKKKKQTQEKVKEIVFRYDFKKMKKQSNYYILDGQGKERETATQDILSLNEIFQHSCCKDLGLYIEVKNIVFETKEVVFASIGEYMEYTSDLSGIRIQYMPYTKTGKLAKYPYWLYFIAENVQKSNNEKVTMFGSIYYLQNGAVGKVGIRFNIKDFYVTINKNDKGEIKCNRVRIEGSKF